MNLASFDNKLNKLIFQRNVLVFLSLFLLLSNVLLGVANLLQFDREKIVITPAVINKKFWVAGNDYSDSYLEQMAEYFAGLMLSINKHNANNRINKILEHVHPKYYATMKNNLIKQVNVVSEKGFSSSFSPSLATVNKTRLAVELQGILETKVGNRVLNSNLRKFVVEFETNAGKLLIKNLQLKDE